jgi:nicotinate-nucleotide adenylyltransferase
MTSKPTWRVAIYGGVFDPPHNAHAEGVKLVQEKYNFDHLVVSVCHTPCHKNLPIAPYEKRLFMTKLMVDMGVRMRPEVAPVGDAHLPQPSYTINQVKDFHETLSSIFSVEVSVIIGCDEWNSFPSWHNAEELYNLCESIIVLERAGCVIQEHDKFECEVIENDIPDISSTKIREMIKSGQDVSNFLTPSVDSLIESWGLYKEE